MSVSQLNCESPVSNIEHKLQTDLFADVKPTVRPVKDPTSVVNVGVMVALYYILELVSET